MVATDISKDTFKDLEADVKYQWVTFKKLGATVIVDKTHTVQLTADQANSEGLKEEDAKKQMGDIWQEAIDSLPDREPRFLVLNHVEVDKEYPDTRFKKVPYFVFWVPGESGFLDKSDYAFKLTIFKGELGASFESFKLTSKGPVRRILADHVNL